MREQILNYCRNDLKRFQTMTDVEIYDWMCGNFASKDYPMIRECSRIVFNESRRS